MTRKTSAELVYLAGFRDLLHHGIVGWDTSASPDTSLMVGALTMALSRTGWPPEGFITPTTDPTSFGFSVSAGNSNVRLSFGSVGDACDNAAIESFWKAEIGWIRGSIVFPTRAQAHAYLFEFIEVFSTVNATKPASTTSPQPNTSTDGNTSTNPKIHKTPCPRKQGNIRTPK